MLKVVEPKDHYYYKARLNLLMGFMGFYQGLSLRLEEQARSTFFLAEKEGNIYGGAILYKKNINEFQEKLKTILSTLLPQRDYIWVCRVFLYTDQEYKNATFYQTFYKDLLGRFVEFGKKEEIDFIYMLFNPFDPFHVRAKEVWPYILNLHYRERHSPLSHGVLSLKDPYFLETYAPLGSS